MVGSFTAENELEFTKTLTFSIYNQISFFLIQFFALIKIIVVSLFIQNIYRIFTLE